MKDIFELTKSELLFADHTEINVPTTIYSLVQLKNDNRQIIAATEESLLVIEFSKKRNTFNAYEVNVFNCKIIQRRCK